MSKPNMNRKALLLGATGLVGDYLLQALLRSSHYSIVNVIARKALSVSDPKLRAVQVDFDKLQSLPHDIFAADDVFLCLGTTRKKTPNTDDYRRIEIDYPLFVAKKAFTNEAHTCHYVSAIGASSTSLSTYSRIKGEAEAQLRGLQQQWPNIACVVYRPSFILGPRTETRVLEELLVPIWKVVEIALCGPLRKYRSIHAQAIAQAMLNNALVSKPGFVVLESDDIAQNSSADEND